MRAIEAIEKASAQNDVKGPSFLSLISHFDLVNGFVPDVLHSALLGVARQFLSLCFDSKNHCEPWSIKKAGSIRYVSERHYCSKSREAPTSFIKYTRALESKLIQNICIVYFFS